MPSESPASCSRDIYCALVALVFLEHVQRTSARNLILRFRLPHRQSDRSASPPVPTSPGIERVSGRTATLSVLLLPTVKTEMLHADTFRVTRRKKQAHACKILPTATETETLALAWLIQVLAFLRQNPIPERVFPSSGCRTHHQVPTPSIAPRSQRYPSTNPRLLTGSFPKLYKPFPANGSTGHQHSIPRSRFFTGAPRLFPACSQFSRKTHQRKYCLECKATKTKQLRTL